MEDHFSNKVEVLSYIHEQALLRFRNRRHQNLIDNDTKAS